MSSLNKPKPQRRFLGYLIDAWLIKGEGWHAWIVLPDTKDTAIFLKAQTFGALQRLAEAEIVKHQESLKEVSK